MAEYHPELTKRVNNLMFMRDGTVWANYVLRGVNVNPYKSESITACQEAHDFLFSQLSRLYASDFLLLGLKTQTPPATIMKNIVTGVPGLTERGKYDQLLDSLNAFYNRMLTGEYAEFQRVYWLSIAFPVGVSGVDKMLSKVAGVSLVDPHRNVAETDITDLEERYYSALPTQFRPVRTTSDHVRWVFDRARQRGICAPFMSEFEARATIDGSNTLAEIAFDQRAEIESLYTDLVQRVTKGDPSVLSRGKRRRLLRALANTFSTVRSSRALTIRNLDTRSDDFPDGYTSIQSQLAIARYPSAASIEINKFTHLVDQAIGLDADFALRFDFDQTAVTKEGQREVMKGLKSEDAANSRDEFDADDYADRQDDVRDWRRTVKSETAPIGMRIAAVFSFAHQNRKLLNQRVDAVKQQLVNNDFVPIFPAFGQYELWRQMMPGAAASQMIEDLKQPTTVRLFSGFMPIRRTVAGDAVGVPVMINKENELGQIVLLDILNATDKGNASIAELGAPNKGKSNLMKSLLAFMIDFLLYAHVIDQSPHSEYKVFAQTLGAKAEIVDVFAPASSGNPRSLDPLKCYPDDEAMRVFLALWLPLLMLKRDSEEAAALASLLEPSSRKSRHITSTRSLLPHLANWPGDVGRKLTLAFGFWARQPYAHAFIDPVVDGEPVDWPSFDPEAHCVIYLTNRIKAWRGGDVPFVDAPPDQQFAAMAYTAIAEQTEHRFSRIDKPCGFFGDEMHFLKDSTVLQRLIGDPNAAGRKDQNLTIVAAQLASALESEHYALIGKKFMFGQDTQDNAVAALKYGDIPQTEKLVTRNLEMSPADAERNNMPVAGREGECWYNDGHGNIIYGQTLPQLTMWRKRMADTTSSRMIRAEDLDVIGNGHKQPDEVHA